MTKSEHVSRLRWRCRRGMRELDKLAEGYLDRDYAAASEGERLAFEQLLELPDPELLALLYEQQVATDKMMQNVLDRMRQKI